jgi:hypothetical protein
VETLVEVSPLSDGKYYWEEIVYDRIRIDVLTAKSLSRFAFKENVFFTPTISENQTAISYKYDSKPPVYISKKDGRIYAERDNFKTRMTAIILLRILNKYDLVVGYKRKQKHRGKRSLWRFH